METVEQIDFTRCPVGDLKPMHPEALSNPAALNRRLREDQPVFEDPESGIFFISRYADVVAMLRDHETFSSVIGNKSTRAIHSAEPEVKAIMAEGYPSVPTMLTQDPPLQRRYRKFVDGAFSSRNLRSIEPFIEATSRQLIQDFVDRGACEFMSEFGVKLPLKVIGSQIGVPMEDLPKLRKWTKSFVDNLGMQLDLEGMCKVATSVVEFQHYFVKKLEERRKNPTDDILSKIVNASIDGEQPLDNSECLSMLSQILVAGNETTASALTEGMWLLIDNPDQCDLIYRDPSPEMRSRFVEEVLRFSSPSANSFRRTTREVVLHGKVIPEGKVCFARFASANHDESHFNDAMSFDILRDNLKEHIAFGKGIHHCLGAALARREMNIGFDQIFKRMKNFRLADGVKAPEFAPNALLHGPTSLHLEFDAIH
ncbi:MAG: cytochrome P450 [Gammaproteobacteria bacterium]|nr:cytochrome P450 [Gammaproteobacteria bacterium]